MIPYVSCMCFGAERNPARRRRAWKLVSAQKGTNVVIGKDDTFCISFRESDEEGLSNALTASEICMLEAVKKVERFPLTYTEQEVRAAGSRSRQPVITRVLDLNLLDDTYAGVTKTLLSKCNSWSFNTFNLDVSTGGRSLSYLLVHLFQEYGFVNHFKLDIVKIWHCFNLMEAAYHRHNPYHNSVHAADVTQAMHCFLQENKFSAHLTPLEAMSSVIAAVAHDLDHPGVTQAFLVATSNHLVNLYRNSSVLENHHWRTAISCLSESGIFDHLDKDIWLDIQRQIRSLILATDITRQKEFLARFKNYLNTECLDMEQDQYRHFALQIALKCADLCNPCRPWPISQRWSYQVCQEFYRQGAYERQLKLPLTPTFDCSRTKVAKIQADFFQFVVSPLFETWDHFLKTPLSNKLLENLRHNYNQWRRRMEMVQKTEAERKEESDNPPEITIDPCSSLDILEESAETRGQGIQLLSADSDVVLKQHRSKSDSGLTPRLLAPKIHMETYSTEELHPSTTLLSLSSITNTVQLRQVYAATKVESHLICPTVFQPIYSCTEACESVVKETESLSQPEKCSDGHCSNDSEMDGSSCDNAQCPPSRCLDGCGTPSPTDSSLTLQTPQCKRRSHSLVTESESVKYLSQVLRSRRASDYGCQSYNKSSQAPKCSFLSNNPSLYQIESSEERELPSCHHTANEPLSNSFSSKGVECSFLTNVCSNKHCATNACICKTEFYKKTPSWCWHISRSFSAERTPRPSHDFDSPLPSWQGSTSSLAHNGGRSGRRGSAPVTASDKTDIFDSQLSSLAGIDSRGGLRGGAERNGASGRRWSIPIETISGMQMTEITCSVQESNRISVHGIRRNSFGLLEPLLNVPLRSESNILHNTSHGMNPGTHSCNRLSEQRTKDEIVDETCAASSNSLLPNRSLSHQESVQRRGSLPTEVPIALMCNIPNPSHHLPNKLSGEHILHSDPPKTSSNRHSLMDHARKHGSPGDLLSVLIGPSGMLNTMQGIVSSQTICEWPSVIAQGGSRRRSGGLEMLTGFWRSRTSDVIGVSMARKLKLRRQLLEDWTSWRTEQENEKLSGNTSSTISALGQQFIYHQRRGSVPLSVSLLSSGSGK
ncbi:uncharacterized protein LOC129218462 [Uloborus diversus]|uniref:uncharacterized protein LOC129218462 n=1 Tax=Uloborus diversus TaxID=327109 RepID=UPI0024098557|nr:uncharacterized protein LOC129218462 [Uloborus diversus]